MNLEEELQSVDLDDLIKRLTLYASNRLNSIGAKDFRGREPIDFVGDLMVKVLEGTRNWNKAKCSFTEFMFGCLKSDISNFLETYSAGQNLNLTGIDLSESKNDLREEEDQIGRMLKSAGADDDELILFEYWLGGVYKPAEIASDLGIDVKEVYGAIKRLQRKIQKIQTQANKIL